MSKCSGRGRGSYGSLHSIHRDAVAPAARSHVTRRTLLRSGAGLTATIAFGAPVLRAAVASPQPPLIAMASSLRFAMGSLIATGATPIRPVYGASGDLARQIITGAPFEAFFSADEKFAELISDTVQDATTPTIYALGRLAVFTGRNIDSPVAADLNNLPALIESNRVRTVAIAHPRNAPYGIRADAALTRLGIAEELRSTRRLVVGQSVQQVAQMAVTGSVDVAFISASAASTTAIQTAGTTLPVDPALYPPLRQALVALPNATEATHAFIRFVLSETGQQILADKGFLPVSGDTTVPKSIIAPTE